MVNKQPRGKEGSFQESIRKCKVPEEAYFG